MIKKILKTSLSLAILAVLAINAYFMYYQIESVVKELSAADWDWSVINWQDYTMTVAFMLTEVIAIWLLLKNWKANRRLQQTGSRRKGR